MHKIGIIGYGYVGSACEYNFSKLPHTQVLYYDKFKPSASHNRVIDESDVVFVCVPTPMREDGSCDTSIVESAIGRIAKVAKSPKAIVIKSTVPPGTTDALQLKHHAHHLVFNPEFLTEANFIDDFARQSLIILGASIQGPCETLTALYRHFVSQQAQDHQALIYHTSAKSAEMVKYATNCFLATKLSYFNEIYQICQSANVEYDVVRDILKRDKRIGTSHMNVPGPDGKLGYSRACLPKDINAFIAFAQSHHVDTTMLDAAWSKNLQVRSDEDWKHLAQVNGKYTKAS